MRPLDLCFVFFKTTNLAHLDAAWYTVARQDFSKVRSVQVLDNDTPESPRAIQEVLSRYPIPVPLFLCHFKHGKAFRTQSWSVNYVTRVMATAPLVFFTRSDFLLNDDCLSRMLQEYGEGPVRFVTSHCHQMGYDAELSNTDALAPYTLPGAPWRQHPKGAASLFGMVPACLFKSTEVDAGVWLTHRSVLVESGGLNETLVSWGYQQQEFQRRVQRAGVAMRVLDAFLYHHLHHFADRNFERAAEEMNRVLY